jgi:hypothetical protein
MFARVGAGYRGLVGPAPDPKAPMQREHQTRTRSPRFLLRLLLLAGGAAIGWLLLSGGPAQADGAGHGSGHAAAAGAPGAPGATGAPAHPVAETVSRAVGPAVSQIVASTPVRVSPGTVHATTKAVTQPLRDLPASTTAVVQTVTASAPEPVRSTTRQLVATAVEPVLAVPSEHVADALDRTAATADAVVDPVLQVAGAESPPGPPTPTGHTETAPDLQHAPPAATSAANTSETARSTIGTVDHDRPTTDSGPAPERPVTPAAPDTPAAPGSPSAAGTAGMLAFALLPAPALLRRRVRAADDPLPAGPACGPDSSPD